MTDAEKFEALQAIPHDRWVSASSLRNHVIGDPLVDWLKKYGRSKGYVRTPPGPLDFVQYIFSQGHAFEARVLHLIRERGFQYVELAAPAGPRFFEPARVAWTLARMREGVEVIGQGMLADPSGCYGSPDLLVRADVVDRLVPGTLLPGEADAPAPGLGTPWHYVVADIKFSGLYYGKAWELKNEHSVPAYKAQVLVYSRALAYWQEVRPQRAFLLGRSWKRTWVEEGVTQVEEGRSCFGRLGAVSTSDADAWDAAEAAIEWRHRLARDGASWVAEPVPSVPELRPNLAADPDAEWADVRARIAANTGELTQLWGVGRRQADHAIALGIIRCDDPALTAAHLGLKDDKADRLAALLLVERDPRRVVWPDHVDWNEARWRTPAPGECFIDFETVNDLGDDFSRLPERGGEAVIFQVGCLHVVDGQPVFAQWTAPTLDAEGERFVIESWRAHLAKLRGDGPVPVAWHWSPAEASTLQSSLKSYERRNPALGAVEVELRDVLREVVRPPKEVAPGRCTVAVKGAHGFGLKAIAKALFKAGRIHVTWEDGVTDGMGAMVAAWKADAERKRSGGTLLDDPDMLEVAKYNEVDVRAMHAVLYYLRRFH